MLAQGQSKHHSGTIGTRRPAPAQRSLALQAAELPGESRQKQASQPSHGNRLPKASPTEHLAKHAAWLPLLRHVVVFGQSCKGLLTVDAACMRPFEPSRANERLVLFLRTP